MNEPMFVVRLAALALAAALPTVAALAQDAENGTIMFNTQTRKGKMNTAWQVRVPQTQKLPYADFAKAVEEAAIVQKQIPLYRPGLRPLRVNTHDALRACFPEPGGRIEIDGRPAATKPDGMCQVLKFDPAVAQAGKSEIVFVGPLDIVTMWVQGHPDE